MCASMVILVLLDIRELPVKPRAMRVIRGYTRCNRVRLSFQERYW